MLAALWCLRYLVFYFLLRCSLAADLREATRLLESISNAKNTYQVQ